MLQTLREKQVAEISFHSN